MSSHTATEESDVFVLEQHSCGNTDTIATYSTLEGAMGHYAPDGPGALSPVLPWTQSVVFGEPRQHWTTRFRSGNDGRLVVIRRMPLNRPPQTNLPNA